MCRADSSSAAQRHAAAIVAACRHPLLRAMWELLLLCAAAPAPRGPATQRRVARGWRRRAALRVCLRSLAPLLCLLARRSGPHAHADTAGHAEREGANTKGVARHRRQGVRAERSGQDGHRPAEGGAGAGEGRCETRAGLGTRGPARAGSNAGINCEPGTPRRSALDSLL